MSTRRSVRPSRSRGGGLAVYYGYGEIDRLARYSDVVLQPGAHSPCELATLRAGGVRVLMYLSLGEDLAEQAADHHLPGTNPVWGTRRVHPAHPAWVAQVRARAVQAAAQADGLFLDTLDSVPDGAAMLRLVRAVRTAVPAAYLLANRGADLLPELGEVVDGVLIEALSTTWEHGYAAHDAGGLAYTAALAERVRASGLPAWGLDYAETPRLAAFARRRAKALGLSTFVSTRSLDLLPDPAPSRARRRMAS